MRLCPLCQAPLLIAECTNHRAWVLPFLYAVLAEHECGSTHSWVLFEVPDEVLIQDGEAHPLNHELDTRECA